MDEHKHPHPHHNNIPKVRKGYRVAFLMAFSVALLAEMLLFMHAQMREISVILKDDFRIIVLRDDKSKETVEAVDAALSAIGGTAQVTYVSRKDRLARLKAEDPELVSSVLVPGLNPMPDTWEVVIKRKSWAI